MLSVFGVVISILATNAQKTAPAFPPVSDDPIAKAAHAKLIWRHSLLDLVAMHGHDTTITTRTEFRSPFLQARIANATWQTSRESPFDYAPEFSLTTEVFDLADAYALCYIAYVELWSVRFAQDGEPPRQWPIAKVRRQFQRALTRTASLDRIEKEHLYFALLRSASIAHQWWIGIRTAITARGDIIGNSPEYAESVIQWLMGVPIEWLEYQYIGDGVQRTIQPRPRR